MSASSSRSSTLEASEPFVRGDIALEFDLENLFRDPPQNALGAISGVSKGCEHEPCSGCRDAVVERDVNAQFALNLVIGKRPNANTGKVRTAEYRILRRSTSQHDYAAAFGQAEDRLRFAGSWLYSATAGYGPFRWPPVKRAGYMHSANAINCGRARCYAPEPALGRYSGIST
jgi:hypothetical protein